jgi:hypothetical protein
VRAVRNRGVNRYLYSLSQRADGNPTVIGTSHLLLIRDGMT